MSKKQGKTKKNVFGLVSKLGSLIKKGGNNQDNSENSGKSRATTENDTPRKNFNIHISEDNQEVFAIGDDDEEEEEEDYEEDENNKKDSKEKNNENINNIKEINKNEIKSENKKEKEDKKIEKKEENIKEEKKEEEIKNKKGNIIQEDTDKDLKNNINSNLVKENNKIGENNNENNNKINIEENKDEENIVYNNTDTCHLYLKKGNDFNSNEILCFPILKNCKRKGVFKKIGFFKKPKYDLLNFKIFIDENFIYLAKDIIIDKKNIHKRRISKVLKVKNIINYSYSKGENNNYHVIIEIINKNGILKKKEFYIDEKYFTSFNEEITKSLKLFGGMYMKNK